MSKKKNKRARYGEGSFRETEFGFEYRIYYTDCYGEKIRKSFYGKSKLECKEKADEFLKKFEKVRHGVDISLTIPDIARMKCEKRFQYNKMREQTYARNLDTILIIARAQIGSVPIVDVTQEMIEDFLLSIRDYAENTIHKIYQQIKSSFEWARDNNLRTDNPFSGGKIECPKSNKQTKKVSALTVEDQKKLVDYLNNSFVPYKYRNDYRLQLMIEMYAGLRIGEVNALRPEDIDLNHNVIHVRGTVARNKENEPIREDMTKTAAGLRDVPISSKLLPYLHLALERYTDNKCGVLFYDHVHDKLISSQQVNCFYGRVCEKLGIKNDGQHCLRHTFATRAIEAGVDAVVLKNWLGHTKISVTLDTYAEVFASLHNAAIATMDEYMKEAV